LVPIFSTSRSQTHSTYVYPLTQETKFNAFRDQSGKTVSLGFISVTDPLTIRQQ
jgi:hypothetical protein